MVRRLSASVTCSKGAPSTKQLVTAVKKDVKRSPDESKKRLQQAGKVASRRAAGFAEARMSRLLMSEQDMEAKVDSMQPFIQRVQALEPPSSKGKVPTRGRGAKGGVVKELLDAHTEVFSFALGLELQEEWLESESRLRSWTRQRLESEGLAIFNLQAILDHNLFTDTIIRLYIPGEALPEHQLSQGDIVLLSKGVAPGASPLDSDMAVEGVILDGSSRWLRVALPSSVADGVRGSGWRLDLYANTVSYERCAAALEAFASGPPVISATKQAKDVVSSAQEMWKVLSGGVQEPGLEELSVAPPTWARGKQGPDRLKEARKAAAALAQGSRPDQLPGSSQPRDVQGEVQGYDRGLNPSQAAAVHAALGRTVTLWQGPPGTGKTRTILRFIKAALAGIPQGKQVLASAASNVAVDNLVAGLLGLGVKVVRIGQPAKVSAALRAVTLEAQMAETPRGQQALKLRHSAAKLSGTEAKAAIHKAMQLEEEVAQEVLSRCEVVACTCIGAGDPRLQGTPGSPRVFPLMVLDEATQATEPAALVPITSKVESLLLVGDPQQLPPTVRSRRAADLGLGVPLFQRLQAQGLKPMLLDTQYRMHPDICAFPSAAFYGNKLMSQPSPQDRPTPAGFGWPVRQVPVCFIPVKGAGEKKASSKSLMPDESAGFSLFNDAEAQQVVTVVQGLIAGGSLSGGATDVGVITPYNGQVRHLQRMVQQLSSRADLQVSRPAEGGRAAGSRALNSLKSSNKAGGGEGDQQGRQQGGWQALEVKSVDGFQGREKEVIVFSAVRSNTSGTVGFLADYRRLNVAITRARRGLIVIGDPDTLSHDPIWKTWLAWSKRRGLWADPPPVSTELQQQAAGNRATSNQQRPRAFASRARAGRTGSSQNVRRSG